MATKYVTLKDSNGDTLYPQAVATNLAPGSITPDEIDNRLYTTLAPVITGATEITANKNLNSTEFLSVGSYYCSTDTTAATLSNAPRSVAFSMTVEAPINNVIDNETTDTYVYRVRKVTLRSGEIFTQKVNSNNTPGTFIYGSWDRLVSNHTVGGDFLASNWGGYDGSTSGLYSKIMKIYMSANWKTYTLKFTFASTQNITFAYDVTCTVHRGSSTSGIDNVKLVAVPLWSGITHDLASRLKAVRIDASNVEIYWQTDSSGSGIAHVYSAASLTPGVDALGSFTTYIDNTSSALPSGTQYSCTVKSY